MRHGFEIRCEKSIFLQIGYLIPHPQHHSFQNRAGLQRRPKLDPLNGAHRFDPDDDAEVPVHALQAPRAVGGHADVILLIG